ncbi:MAG TPA: isoprenylcysteine carboxylmethyltransferase family protein [Gemmatimonadales bacterium]
MEPLPFAWPYGLFFWGIIVWAFAPEMRIVRTAQKAVAKAPDSRDKGSIQIIMIGGVIAMLIAFRLAWLGAFRVPAGLSHAAFYAGTAMLVGGSLLRRHCWRMLSGSFTGDVRARPDQPIVSTGAYRWLRHPSYSAGMLMNTGIGLALGSWGSALVMALGSFAVYSYRISIEERALLEVVGERYREFIRSRRRLIPFIY